MPPDAPALSSSSDAPERTIEALRALNDAYLNAVLTCDVERFREILADDFLCSTPDGALLDKRAFLARTAAPRTLQQLSAHNVRIRISGDTAVIHGATRFTTMDGREGLGRYTDVWVRRGNTWRAISAHVTRLA
jgi:ketosteroid isomerase-like protein